MSTILFSTKLILYDVGSTLFPIKYFVVLQCSRQFTEYIHVLWNINSLCNIQFIAEISVDDVIGFTSKLFCQQDVHDPLLYKLNSSLIHRLQPTKRSNIAQVKFHYTKILSDVHVSKYTFCKLSFFNCLSVCCVGMIFKKTHTEFDFNLVLKYDININYYKYDLDVSFKYVKFWTCSKYQCQFFCRYLVERQMKKQNYFF